MGLLSFLQRAKTPAPERPTAAPAFLLRLPRDYHELDDLIRHCITRAVPDLGTRVMATTAADLLRSIFSEHPTAVKEALAG